jgi:heptosyltransferase-2
MTLPDRLISTFFRVLGMLEQTPAPGAIGALWFALDGKHRGIARRNLQTAFPGASSAEIRRLSRSVFHSLSRIPFEIGAVMPLTPDRFHRRFRLSGAHHYYRAERKGRGVLVVTGHVGNWELLPVIAWMLLEKPPNILYRPLDFGPLNEFFIKNRSRLGGKPVPTAHAMRRILRALSRSETIAVLYDQNVDWYEGVFVDFFGKRACTNKGLPLVSLRSGAPVVPLFLIREKTGFVAKIGPEIKPVQTGDKRKDVEETAREFNRALEEIIRKHPDQWLFVHQRWKTPPARPWSPHRLSRPALPPGFWRPRRRLREKTFFELMVRIPNWVGDAVMCTPALRAIRCAFPRARITLVGKPWVLPLFQNAPFADRLYVYDAGGRHRGVRGKIRLAADLHEQHFAAAVLFQNAFEAAFIARLAKIPVRIGYNTDGRTLLLTHPVPRTREKKRRHMIDYYLGMLAGIGVSPCGRRPELPLSVKERERAATMLSRLGVSVNAPVVGLNPGAAYGTAKRWVPARFADLAGRLHRRFGAEILIFGAPGEAALGAAMARDIGDYAVNLAGKTDLRQAVALIERCRLFVTNDSGLMHIAAAFNVPQVAVFGPTDPVTTYPFSPNSRIVRVPTECSPCLLPECPRDHRCMTAITVERVFEAASTLFSIRRPPL